MICQVRSEDPTGWRGLTQAEQIDLAVALSLRNPGAIIRLYVGKGYIYLRDGSPLNGEKENKDDK